MKGLLVRHYRTFHLYNKVVLRLLQSTAKVAVFYLEPLLCLSEI